MPMSTWLWSALPRSIRRARRLLAQLFAAAPHLPVIVHHRTGTIDDVIHLTRQGAFHVLLGDIEPESLADAVGRAVRQSQARDLLSGNRALAAFPDRP